MPKINVYLPDDLAAAVRAAGFPVSPVCQEALAVAVRNVSRARKAIGAIRDPGFDPGRHPALASSLHSRMTPRLEEVLRLARQAGGGPAGTGRLLLGVLEEGHNLGLRLLQALDIDTGELAAVLRQADLTEQAPDVGGAGPRSGTGSDPAGLACGRHRSRGGYRAGAQLPRLRAPGPRAGRGDRQRGRPGAARSRRGAGGRAQGAPVDPGRLCPWRRRMTPPGEEGLTDIMRRLDALEARVATLGGVSG